MKKNYQSLMICATLSILIGTSCSFTRNNLDGVFTSDCKRFGIGSICFQNTSSEAIDVKLKNHQMEVLPFTTLCIDMYEGDYKYEAKRKRDKWKDNVYVDRCKEHKVKLEEYAYLD